MRFSLFSPGRRRAVAVALAAAGSPALADAQAPDSAARRVTTEVPFTSHDGYPMFGKLTLPVSPGHHAVVVYVQTAEGMTVDMKRSKAGGGTFNYFDLYAEKLPPMDVGFFRYEGRGIRVGDKPPRFEQIDPDVYNTSTLDNKVRDVLSAVEILGKQPGVDPKRSFLMGASEGTLLAAEAASRDKKKIAGLVLYAVMSGTMRDMFRYIMTDGGFLAYVEFFDTDRDGKISRSEFEADPRKYREMVWKNAPFSAFDKNGDRLFTAADMPYLTKPYLDAIDSSNYPILDTWAKTAAGVSTPNGWFKDHFAHPPIWTFLSELDIPVGFFQGEADPAVPVAGVRDLEERARKAGKTRMQFHYFPGPRPQSRARLVLQDRQGAGGPSGDLCVHRGGDPEALNPARRLRPTRR